MKTEKSSETTNGPALRARPAEGLASSLSARGKITKNPRIMMAGPSRAPRACRRIAIVAVTAKAGITKHRSRM
jgi:hypothetical protein